MKVKMQAQQLWDAVEYGDADFHNDRRVFEALLVAVPPEMGATLVDKPIAKHAWDSIAAMRIGVDRVCRATLQKLRQDWDRLGFRPGMDINEFSPPLLPD